MKKMIFCCLFAVAAMFSFTNANNVVTSCPDPSNVHKTFSSSGAISFDWDDCSGGCSEYEVQFVRLSDNYTSSWYSTSVSNYSFSGLQAGGYKFYFRTICGGVSSSSIVIEDRVWM